jgi:malate dehydrogenase (oxaloacetate-decarboxylating)
LHLKEFLEKNKGIIKTRTKVPIFDSYSLSLVYTPGVGECCKEIVKNPDNVNKYTNKANTIAVIYAISKEKALSVVPYAELRAFYYKKTAGIDAYPLVLETEDVEEIAKILLNLTPTFCGYDLSLTADNIKKQLKNKIKNLKIPVLYEQNAIKDIPDGFFPTPPLVTQNNNETIFDELKQKNLSINEDSLELHEITRGVIETDSSLSLRATNGSAAIQNDDDFCLELLCHLAPRNDKTELEEISAEIIQKPQKAFELTSKSNLIAVISDGSAVLGFGNIGPDAALPVMEGKAALFKTLANIDSFPLCLNTQDPDEFIQIVSKLTPVLGGINLEDISAPRCFEIEQKLIEICDIPVFHDDQHGTAIVVLAGFLNALKLTGKKIDEIKVVMTGAGAAAQSVAKLLIGQGVKNIVMSDIKGSIYKDRPEMDRYLEYMAKITNPENEKGSIEDIIKNADVFIGLSAGGIISPKMIKSMKKNPVVFALANPMPEIMPDLAKEAGAFIVATGRSDFKNQINNSLAFPGLFRGTLDAKAKVINNEMKLAAASAIASLVKDDKLSPDYIIPAALDRKVAPSVAKAVFDMAIKTQKCNN